MKRLTTLLVLAILLAGLVPTALAQGPVGTTPDETATSRAAGPTESPGDAGVDAMRILDDFNRADGPIGAHWTVRDGDCTVSNNAAVCGGSPAGRATLNNAPGNGDAAEADVAVDGTDLQYTGLLLNYGAGVDNLFIKVQQQAPYAGQFTHAACYTGNAGPGFGLGFFPLDAPFSTAHMKVTRVGDDVTIEFTHVDGGAQPPQAYLCTGAPPREGTGIGILGYNGIARLDNFGVPAHPPLNSDGLLYMTSLDEYDPTFAVYNPGTDAWTTLAAYETGCQMAVSSAGELYAHNYHTGNIDRYHPATDTWTPVIPAPPGTTGNMCNLEVTNDGEFLYAEFNNTTLWYTLAGNWHTMSLPFAANATGDYDPLTDQYVIGEWKTTNAHLIDVHTWAITDYTSPLPNGEIARSGVVLGNRYYFEAAGSNMHSFDLDSPALPPLDHGVSPGWYTGAAADRFYGVIYNASLDGTELNRFDPATNVLTPLTSYGTATWHTSLAFVPGPPMSAQKIAPPFAAPGDVISYTVVISAPLLADGMYMSDTLPLGVAYAGSLTWTHGLAWYDDVDNAVYWEYTAPPPAAPPSAPAPIVYDPASAVDLVGGAEPAGLPPAGLVTPWAYPEAVLWDNGPQVTHPGDCAGMDASRLQTGLGMNTYAFGHQFSLGYRMADDFQIVHPLGWQIDSVTFFAYQTNAPSDPSPITGVYFQIWDGPPDDPGSSVVWGDLVTNRLVSSTGVNMQRDSETSPCANNRYVFADVASAGVTLPPGTYWLDWMTDGTLASGPWAPPITILGQTTTGNSLQTLDGVTWNAALDTGTGTPQGMPFVIAGTLAGPTHVTVTFDVTVTAACGDVIVNEGTVGRGPLVYHFGARTIVVGEPDIAVAPPALAAALCPDTTVVRTLGICNAGTCDLTWAVYEQTRTQALPPVGAVGLELPLYEGVSSAGPAPAAPLPGGVPPSEPIVPLGTLAYTAEYVNGYWTAFDLDVPGVLPNRGAFAPVNFPGAGEYVDGYVYVADTANNLFQVDPATGVVLNTMAITPPPGTETYTGMALDPTTGVVYASSCDIATSHLFVVDVATGVATLVGEITGSPATIAIAVDGSGQLWGYDIVNDVFMAIDKATGAGTVIGPIGFDANFGQGMGWDPTTDQVYMAAFNGGTFRPELRTVDTTTGATTLVGVLGSTMPGGLAQLPFLAVPIAIPMPVDVPWGSENPTSGTLLAGECTVVDVTFDATGYGPGDYFANLLVVSNDPDTPHLVVPVTMTVHVPAEIITITHVITDLTVAFTAEVTGTGPFTYTWDLGDGSTSAEANPVHTYAAGGTYTVTLDLANCATDQLAVVITLVAPVEDYRIYLPIIVRNN